MSDINTVIDMVVERTGLPEKTVDKVLRSMFQDIQHFTSKKQGVNIQIPQVGTFIFRAHAIPNYATRVKSTLAHWIARLYIGQHKKLEKTVIAAVDNIDHCLYSLERVSVIKRDFLNHHAKYRPKTTKILLEDSQTDMDRMEEYTSVIKAQLFPDKDNPLQEKPLP